VLILGLPLALIVGLTMGVLGGGGSILTVPILVYILHFGAKEAVTMSLAVVGATSLVGAVRHAQLGNVHLRLALGFGPVAMLGTYSGAHLATYLSDTAHLALFGVIMFTAAFFMLRTHEPAPAPRRHPAIARALVAAEALGVGLITGLVGVGGGFLMVPVFVLLLDLPLKEAVGTSLVVIALNAFTGFVGYLGHVEVAWPFTLGFTAIAIAGIWIGAQILEHVPAHAVKRIFGIFLLLMGAWILYQNRGVLREGLTHTPAAPARSAAAVSDPADRGA
jgi:uncharacterized membrane protein YfcA